MSQTRRWFVAPGARVATLAALVLALALPATLSLAEARPPARTYRIGFLAWAGGPPPSDRTADGCPIPGKSSRNFQAMLEGLRERGYVPGRNLAITCRWTEMKEERALPLARELVEMKVDLIVALSTISVRAAKEATRSIPIVMIGVHNPVGTGLIATIARPGGNVTGLADDAGPEIYAKYLQLLQEAVPSASRIAALHYQTEAPLPKPYTFGAREALESAAQTLQLTLQFYPVGRIDDLDDAFAAITRDRARAVLVIPHPFLYVHAKQVVELAMQSRLPGMFPGREHVEAGGLMSYDIDRTVTFRRIGHFVDKILMGANPRELPVEQPTKFELLVNLRSAKALGIAIPSSLLMHADEVIQ